MKKYVIFKPYDPYAFLDTTQTLLPPFLNSYSAIEAMQTNASSPDFKLTQADADLILKSLDNIYEVTAANLRFSILKEEEFVAFIEDYKKNKVENEKNAKLAGFLQGLNHIVNAIEHYQNHRFQVDMMQQNWDEVVRRVDRMNKEFQINLQFAKYKEPFSLINGQIARQMRDNIVHSCFSALQYSYQSRKFACEELLTQLGTLKTQIERCDRIVAVSEQRTAEYQQRIQGFQRELRNLGFDSRLNDMTFGLSCIGGVAMMAGPQGMLVAGSCALATGILSLFNASNMQDAREEGQRLETLINQYFSLIGQEFEKIRHYSHMAQQYRNIHRQTVEFLYQLCDGVSAADKRVALRAQIAANDEEIKRLETDKFPYQNALAKLEEQYNNLSPKKKAKYKDFDDYVTKIGLKAGVEKCKEQIEELTLQGKPFNDENKVLNHRLQYEEMTKGYKDWYEKFMGDYIGKIDLDAIVLQELLGDDVNTASKEEIDALKLEDLPNYENRKEELKNELDHLLHARYDVANDYRRFREAQRHKYQVLTVLLNSTAAVLIPLHSPRLEQFVYASSSALDILMNIESLDFSVKAFNKMSDDIDKFSKSLEKFDFSFFSKLFTDFNSVKTADLYGVGELATQFLLPAASILGGSIEIFNFFYGRYRQSPMLDAIKKLHIALTSNFELQRKFITKMFGLLSQQIGEIAQDNRRRLQVLQDKLQHLESMLTHSMNAIHNAVIETRISMENQFANSYISRQIDKKESQTKSLAQYRTTTCKISRERQPKSADMESVSFVDRFDKEIKSQLEAASSPFYNGLNTGEELLAKTYQNMARYPELFIGKIAKDLNYQSFENLPNIPSLIYVSRKLAKAIHNLIVSRSQLERTNSDRINQRLNNININIEDLKKRLQIAKELVNNTRKFLSALEGNHISMTQIYEEAKVNSDNLSEKKRNLSNYREENPQAIILKKQIEHFEKVKKSYDELIAEVEGNYKNNLEKALENINKQIEILQTSNVNENNNEITYLQQLKESILRDLDAQRNHGSAGIPSNVKDLTIVKPDSGSEFLFALYLQIINSILILKSEVKISEMNTLAETSQKDTAKFHDYLNTKKSWILWSKNGDNEKKSEENKIQISGSKRHQLAEIFAHQPKMELVDGYSFLKELSAITFGSTTSIFLIPLLLPASQITGILFLASLFVSAGGIVSIPLQALRDIYNNNVVTSEQTSIAEQINNELDFLPTIVSIVSGNILTRKTHVNISASSVDVCVFMIGKIDGSISISFIMKSDYDNILKLIDSLVVITRGVEIEPGSNIVNYTIKCRINGVEQPLKLLPNILPAYIELESSHPWITLVKEVNPAKTYWQSFKNFIGPEESKPKKKLSHYCEFKQTEYDAFKKQRDEETQKGIDAYQAIIKKQLQDKLSNLKEAFNTENAVLGEAYCLMPDNLHEHDGFLPIYLPKDFIERIEASSIIKQLKELDEKKHLRMIREYKFELESETKMYHLVLLYKAISANEQDKFTTVASVKLASFDADTVDSFSHYAEEIDGEKFSELRKKDPDAKEEPKKIARKETPFEFLLTAMYGETFTHQGMPGNHSVKLQGDDLGIVPSDRKFPGLYILLSKMPLNRVLKFYYAQYDKDASEKFMNLENDEFHDELMPIRPKQDWAKSDADQVVEPNQGFLILQKIYKSFLDEQKAKYKNNDVIEQRRETIRKNYELLIAAIKLLTNLKYRSAGVKLLEILKLKHPDEFDNAEKSENIYCILAFIFDQLLKLGIDPETDEIKPEKIEELKQRMITLVREVEENHGVTYESLNQVASDLDSCTAENKVSVSNNIYSIFYKPSRDWDDATHEKMQKKRKDVGFFKRKIVFDDTQALTEEEFEALSKFRM